MFALNHSDWVSLVCGTRRAAGSSSVSEKYTLWCTSAGTWAGFSTLSNPRNLQAVSESVIYGAPWNCSISIYLPVSVRRHLSRPLQMYLKRYLTPPTQNTQSFGLDAKTLELSTFCSGFPRTGLMDVSPHPSRLFRWYDVQCSLSEYSVSVRKAFGMFFLRPQSPMHIGAGLRETYRFWIMCWSINFRRSSSSSGGSSATITASTRAGFRRAFLEACWRMKKQCVCGGSLIWNYPSLAVIHRTPLACVSLMGHTKLWSFISFHY